MSTLIIIIDYDNDSDMNRACSCYWLRLFVGITLESEAKLLLITASTSRPYTRASSLIPRERFESWIPSSIGPSCTRGKEGIRGMMMHETPHDL